MKKVLLALTAVAAMTGSAFAADMAPRTYAKAPVVPAPVASWTGLWISGGFGYGLADFDHNTYSTAAVPVTFDTGHDNGARGWLGKVGFGGDYQINDFVLGGFVDGQWTGIKGNYSFNCPGGCVGPTGYIGQIKNDWSWSVGGRIGYIALPGLLTYFNGGYTQAHFTQVDYLNAATSAVTNLALPAQTRSGWFLGGGTEYAIKQIPGLFWKSEYRLSDFGSKASNQTCLVTGTCGVAGTVHSIDNSHIYVQTATTELVYRFNWGGPVVAKY